MNGLGDPVMSAPAQQFKQGSTLGYGEFDANPRERHLYMEYPSVRGKTLFLPKDRLYLTRMIIDEVFDFVLVKEPLI